MTKTLIHLRRFPDGIQGTNVPLGTVERAVRQRRLYLSSGRRGCASARMEWQEVLIVSLAGRDYVVQTQAGDFVVELAKDDPIPQDLRVPVGGA